MEVKAIKLEQNGSPIFVCTIKARDLLRIAKIDEWNPALIGTGTDEDYVSKQGYQRAPLRTHFIKVARYLSDEKDTALLPTSVLLSARTDLVFRHAEGAIDGTLILKEEDQPLYIVDGQHRIEGLRYAIEEEDRVEFEDFAMPVVIVSNLDKEEEIRQFHTINSTAKKIRPDLADRLLQMQASVNPHIKLQLVGKGTDWRNKAIDVVDKLNALSGNPWYKRIRKPNEGRTPDGVATERSFTTSLKDALTADVNRREDIEVVVSRLANFWGALEDLMPEAFTHPAGFVIQKTPGMYTLHRIFPVVVYECMRQGDFSREKMKEILSRSEEHFGDAHFWESGNTDGAAMYNSVGAFRILSDDMLNELDL